MSHKSLVASILIGLREEVPEFEDGVSTRIQRAVAEWIAKWSSDYYEQGRKAGMRQATGLPDREARGRR